MPNSVVIAALLALWPGVASAEWHVTPAPVWEGQYTAVGDPSIVRQSDGTYQMFHHCLDVLRDPQGSEICLALSDDGLNWRHARTPESAWLVRGRALRARIGDWDEAHETPAAKRGPDGTVWLYVLGYRGAGVFDEPHNAGIGLVKGDDDLRFSWMGDPILRPSVPEDTGGLTSPTLAQTPEGTVMLYTGWACSMADPTCLPRQKLTLMAVPLGRDGLPDGTPRPVLGDPGPAWANGGTSEAGILRGPDGMFYLAFSSLPGPRDGPYFAQRIGLARAASPFGPWEVAPDPILTPEVVGQAWGDPALTAGGVLAPDLAFENGQVRMWFHAFALDEAGGIAAARIGHAVADWPIWPD